MHSVTYPHISYLCFFSSALAMHLHDQCEACSGCTNALTSSTKALTTSNKKPTSSAKASTSSAKASTSSGKKPTSSINALTSSTKALTTSNKKPTSSTNALTSSTSSCTTKAATSFTKASTYLSHQPIQDMSVKAIPFRQRQAQRMKKQQQSHNESLIDLETVKTPPDSPRSSQWLSSREKKTLLNGRWLSDTLINAGQELIHQQFPHISELQDVALGHTLAFSVMYNEFVQVLHNGEGHWVTLNHWMQRCSR